MRFLSRAPVDLQEGSRRNKGEDRIVKGRKGRVKDVKSNHIVRNKIEWIVVMIDKCDHRFRRRQGLSSDDRSMTVL